MVKTSSVTSKFPKEKLHKMLVSGLKEMEPVLRGVKEPRNNIDEKIEKWKRWAEEC